ncbi:MAG: CDP-diacylglycerol--serine O-phosphatidyltransferase [candidate division NC10 bacterium RBG_16_65_8]|nr:MAG: CDP-diacylglycerol--serine O-phosphatidyltransferase [candidate division NC10 bacterium RBG_16_65_8]
MKPSRSGMRRRMRRGVYLLPSILTLGNLFCGFYALIAVYNDEYVTAAVAIILAEVFDYLDGGVARMTGATSELGIQLDSLADLVSFGVAPGLLAYVFALKPFGWIGALAAFAFAACGAFRLARFNIQTHVLDKRYFVGLPIPAAAAVVATFVLFMKESSAVVVYGRELVPPHATAAGVLLAMYGLGFLMVSRIRYRSLKGLEMRKRRPATILTTLLLLLVIVASHPSLFLFVFFLLYAFSGIVRILPFWQRRYPAETTEHPAHGKQ